MAKGRLLLSIVLRQNRVKLCIDRWGKWSCLRRLIRTETLCAGRNPHSSDSCIELLGSRRRPFLSALKAPTKETMNISIMTGVFTAQVLFYQCGRRWDRLRDSQAKQCHQQLTTQRLRRFPLSSRFLAPGRRRYQKHSAHVCLPSHEEIASQKHRTIQNLKKNHKSLDPKFI